MLAYFSQLHTGRVLLWSYLIWYITISIEFFDSDPHIWFTALGISLIVGFALTLSTRGWPMDVRGLDRWQTFRLFLIPFCVSSYSLLIER